MWVGIIHCMITKLQNIELHITGTQINKVIIEIGIYHCTDI